MRFGFVHGNRKERFRSTGMSANFVIPDSQLAGSGQPLIEHGVAVSWV
jgi:hypothetical protein